MVVSESPEAAAFDVYARAYREEVERIRDVQGGGTVAIFPTRRIEKAPDKDHPKKTLAGLFTRAMHHDANSKS